MKWRILGWVLRIAVLAAILYGLWCGVAYFAGKHYFRQGMTELARSPEAAMRCFETAATLQPRNARYRAAVGRAALKAENYPEAMRHLRRATELEPANFALWHDLGEACLKADAPADAVQAFRRALAIRPEADLALEGLAEAATRAGDSQAALDPLRQLWKRTPNDVALAGKLASALAKEGKCDEALEVCARARKRAPEVEPGVLWSGLQPEGDWGKWCPLLIAEGTAYRAKGRFAEAIIAYQRCLMIEHGNPAALDGLRELRPEVCRQLAPDRKVRAARFSPDGKRIAFQAGRLCVTDLDGETVAEIAPWTRRGRALPAWSPDGKRICYADDRTLRIAKADGSGARALIARRPALPQLAKLGISASWASSLEFESDPTWSPNGRVVAAYLHQDHGSGLSVVIDPDTGAARMAHQAGGKVPPFAAEHPPAWSPDGRVLCAPLHYPGSKLPGVTLWSADGTVKRQLGAPREGVNLAEVGHAIREVSWSPDTRHLALILRTGNPPRHHLALLPVSGKPGHIVAKDVVAHRWLDASHVWVLQATGDSYLTARLRALTCDLQGNLKPAKEPFPVLLLDEWDLTRGATVAVMSGPAFGTAEAGDKGLWVLDLQKLRRPS